VLWARLLSFHQSGFLLTASIGGKGEGSAAAEVMGLLSEHAYSLLQVRMLNDRSDRRGNAVRLCQLRNPWGKLSWRGAWSEGSPLWTERTRAALQPRREAGVFWMAWEDVCRHFTCVDVCRVRPDWHVLRMHGALPTRPVAEHGTLKAFEVHVEQTTQLEVTCMQRNPRGTADILSDLLLLLLRRRGDSASGQADDAQGSSTRLRLIACSERLAATAVSSEALLSPGSYIVLPLTLRSASWRGADGGKGGGRDGGKGEGRGSGTGGGSSASGSLVLRIGAAKPVVCDLEALPALDAAAAIGAYVRLGQRRDVADRLRLFTMQDSCGQLTYVENCAAVGSGVSFKVQLDHRGSVNVNPSRGDMQCADVLPPMRGQLLQIAHIGPGEGMAQIRTQLQCWAEDSAAEAHAPETRGTFMHATICV